MFPFKRFLTHNWFLKLFSVLVASLLWLTIASETNSVINRTVALEFQGIPPNMEITGETATEVDLQLARIVQPAQRNLPGRRCGRALAGRGNPGQQDHQSFFSEHPDAVWR